MLFFQNVFAKVQFSLLCVERNAYRDISLRGPAQQQAASVFARG